jgi:glucose-6-phosphate 1-dehydrogenase
VASVPTDAPDREVGENPLVEGLERLPVPPTTMVIFGASGDLAHRKLLPALYNLAHEGALPERFNLVGAARRQQTDEEFREVAKESIEANSRRKPDPQVLDGLLERMRYVSVPFDDGEAYATLGKVIEQLDEEAGQPLARLYYLSTAPDFFAVIAEQLKEAGLHRHKKADIRVVIEKPFGTDLESARKLQQVVSSVFRERQVFRIDHYLGKETVQNVLAFRFANLMFEPVWNRNYIDHVQITAAEDIGIGSRAGYYDSSGALRDLVENHMLQLLTLLCMEPPASFDADKVRDEKVKVLDAITPMTPEDVERCTVRAQYAAGSPGGEDVPGYLDEEDVPDDSETETYAALKLEVHNWRWQGVPFFLRTGKRLSRKTTEIAVQLKPVPHLAFSSDGSVGVQPNLLILAVQPNEGVSLSLGAKIPGSRMRIRPVNMEFLYGSSFMSQSPEAYERLIQDAMRGEATLFTRDDEVIGQWSIIDPILKAWQQGRPSVSSYPAGSPGPPEADELIAPRKWRGL